MSQDKKNTVNENERSILAMQENSLSVPNSVLGLNPTNNIVASATNVQPYSMISKIIMINRIVDNKGPVTGSFLNGATTDDDTPELQGVVTTALNPDEMIVIFRDGVPVGVATLNLTSWSFTDAGLESGKTYVYTAQIQDINGNTSNMSSSFSIVTQFSGGSGVNQLVTLDSIVDDVDPVQGIIAVNGKTNDTTPTLNGKLSEALLAGESIVIYRNGVEVGTAVVTGTNWTYTSAPLATDGSYIYKAAVRNATGVDTQVSNEYKIILDTAPVVIQSVEITSIIDDANPVTGAVLNGGFTNDKTPLLKGRINPAVLPGDTVLIYRDGVYKGTAQLSGSDWQFTDTLVTDGTYNYTAVIKNQAGVEGPASSKYTITLDTVVPSVLVLDSVMDAVGPVTGPILPGGITDDKRPVLNGHGAEPGSTIVLKDKNGNVLNEVTADATGAWSVRPDPFKALVDGLHTLQIVQVDKAGNESAPIKFDLTVSASVPNVTGLTTTFALDVDTADGIPASGYTNTINAKNNDFVTRDYTPTFKGALNRALANGESLQISKDGGLTWKDVSLTGSTWSYVSTDVYSANTTLNLKFRVKNTAGASAEIVGQNHQVHLELTTPDNIQQAPIVSGQVTPTNTYTFNSATYGTLKPGTIIALVNDVNNNGMWQEGIDRVIAKAVVNANGSWSLTTTLPKGALNLAFMTWDVAGNLSRISDVTHVSVKDPDGGFEVITTNWGGTTSGGMYDGTNGLFGINVAAAGVSVDGGWSFFQSARLPSGKNGVSGRVYEVQGTNYSSEYLANPTGMIGKDTYGASVTSAVFADINRDGRMDVMSQIGEYGYSKTAYWMANSNGTYSPQTLAEGTTVHIGGVVAYDRTGDGYLDFVLADSEADSITFVQNNAGTLSIEPGKFGHATPGMPVSGAFEVRNGLGTSGVIGTIIPNKAAILHDVAAVDLDNNGTVDIAAHTGTNNGVFNALGQDLGLFYNSGTSNGFTFVAKSNVFKNDGIKDFPNLLQSLTFADFNGDGWLDLYINKGADRGLSRTTTSGNSDESRIYLNDGTGKLKATSGEALWFGDNKGGGASFAVDWNLDGKMDVIEVPAQVRDQSTITTSFATTLYLNNGNNNWGGNTVLMGSAYNDVTGAVAVDYDWDGAVDLILYHAGTNALVGSTDNAAPSTLIRNTNVVTDGTSMHVRILDGMGINSFYGNTVKLYDSAGNLVSTQVLNPQSSASSDSTGIVNFYGLKANETYSVQLLRITNGNSNNVGGVPNLGGYTNNTINSSWSGLKAGKGNENYVLTAESNTSINHSSSNGVGITGTGYNDHFFGSAGNDHYNGGGGWQTSASGVNVWVANGGQDVLDYSKLQNATITINAATSTVTKVIDGMTFTDTYENIEKFITTSGTVNFNGSTNNETISGGSGNDTYNLGGFGNGSDIIYFSLLNATDATGGNGFDLVKGFGLGQVANNPDADVIDIHELLTGYNGTAGLYLDTDGLKLDAASSQLNEYLKVRTDGANTIIEIDRNGGGDSFSNLLTLENIQTDLVTLLFNNQIVI